MSEEVNNEDDPEWFQDSEEKYEGNLIDEDDLIDSDDNDNEENQNTGTRGHIRY